MGNFRRLVCVAVVAASLAAGGCFFEGEEHEGRFGERHEEFFEGGRGEGREEGREGRREERREEGRERGDPAAAAQPASPAVQDLAN